jgi:hypothetical protein
MIQLSNQTEIIFYTTPNGEGKIDTVFQNETIWLTQAKMAELFGVQRPAITKHLKNIFESGELDEQVASSILEHTTQHGAIEGKTRKNTILRTLYPVAVDIIQTCYCIIHRFRR